MLNKAIDTYLVFQFIKRLSSSFKDWEAFKSGVIDANGDILVPKNKRTTEQNKSFGKFDLLTLKLKKLLAKVPGGSSKIASYMAAMWLIKEWNHFTPDSLINESMSEDNIDSTLEVFLETYFYYTHPESYVNQKMYEDGISGAPTVNVGSGAIAGLGVGPQGEPGLTISQQKKHRKRAANTMPDPINGRRITSALR